MIDEIKPYLEVVLPFLVSKTEQAMFMLEFLSYENPSYQQPDWKITQGREFCFQEVTKLNKRGPK